MKKISIFVFACCMLLAGCTSKSKSDVQTLSKNQELTSLLKQDQTTLDFVLLGNYYELPCKLQVFYDQGWELIDQIEVNPFVKETLSLKGNESVTFTLFKDYKRIDLSVANLGLDEAIVDGEATVFDITVYHTDNMMEDDMIWEGGATFKTSLDDLEVIYKESKDITDEKSRLIFSSENKNFMRIKKNSEDKMLMDSVQLTLGSDVYKRTDLLRFYDNEVIDKAKNASLTLIMNCESNKNYLPEEYNTLLADLKNEDEEVRNLIVEATVVEKAIATNGSILIGMDDKEIYVVEDALGNGYAFYSKVKDTVVASDLVEGDKVKLYCSYAELIEVAKDTYYPLLDAEIVYVNDVLFADASAV